MKIVDKENTFRIICFGAFFITIVMTPWMNSDSLIIPKLISLFCLALFLIPKLIALKSQLLSNQAMKALSVIISLIVIQMVLVLYMSEAPLEQQIFGRTGRGLGFITEISLLVVLVSSAFFIRAQKIKTLFIFLIFSSTITTVYSVLQRFDLDVFDWTTRTNGIIGTLGNPNFQASFAAMTFFPSVVYFWDYARGKIYASILAVPILVLIYISQSTQGYVTLLTSVFIYFLVFSWYRKKFIFTTISIGFIVSIFLLVSGMLNNGPWAKYLFKASVQSRGEMFKTSFTVANENPFFGVGLDSLGDYYLLYRDETVANGIAEFTDNSHNLFLNYASTGGYPLGFLHLLLALFVIFSFMKLQSSIGRFDKKIAALFCAWVCYLQQSLISPANISMLTWNAIISGTLVGLAAKGFDEVSDPKISRQKLSLATPFSTFMAILGMVFCYPYFNVDRQQLTSLRTGNVLLGIQSAKSYPESSIRYSRIGQEFIKSNMPGPALELARTAVEFNPNAISAWALILVNNTATLEERVRAKNEILRLDPFNKEVKSLMFDPALPTN
jgi:hypothetical protein